MSVESSLESAANATTNFIKNNAGEIIAGAGGLIVGTGVGVAAGMAINKTSKKKRKTSSKSRKSNHRNSSKRRVRYTPHTAGKGKDTSHKRIRQTKNGQPYVIMANGRARFISKASARRSRRTSGGRY